MMHELRTFEYRPSFVFPFGNIFKSYQEMGTRTLVCESAVYPSFWAVNASSATCLKH